MKKFKFQLEAVLKVTQLKKDRAEIAFAEAMDFLHKQEQLLKEQETALNKAYQEYNEVAERKSINVFTLTMYSNYFEHLKQRIIKQQAAIVEAEKTKQEKLAALQEEINRLKSIEKLKEKRYQEFLAAEMADEQKNLDEIGLQIYVRTTR